MAPRHLEQGAGRGGPVGAEAPAQEPADPGAWERLALDLTPPPGEAVPDHLGLADSLSRLPAEHREVLRLRFDEDLSHEAIGERLGISAGNARLRLCRILAAARALTGAAPGEAQR